MYDSIMESSQTVSTKKNNRKKNLMSLTAFVTFIITREKKRSKRNGGVHCVGVCFHVFICMRIGQSSGLRTTLRDKNQPSKTPLRCRHTLPTQNIQNLRNSPRRIHCLRSTRENRQSLLGSIQRSLHIRDYPRNVWCDQRFLKSTKNVSTSVTQSTGDIH